MQLMPVPVTPKTPHGPLATALPGDLPTAGVTLGIEIMGAAAGAPATVASARADSHQVRGLPPPPRFT